jgi:xanthine dehydrogenase accessory factor
VKALQQIIRRVAENPSRPWALATLVQTEGSTYRKPGARLLVDSEGRTLGVLSGGCLEEEIARHGQKVIADASPVLLSFDTKRLYGCDGQLKILVEPIPAAGQNGNLITRIGQLLSNREVCRVRTCFEGDTLGSELLTFDALLPERRGVFIDTVPLPVRLLLFGTGPEIEPIIELAGNLGWVVERFGHPSELEGDFRPDAQTAAVVATHNFGRDFATLQKLLSLNLRYAGLIGPRKRRDQLLNHLLDPGVTINPGFFSPAGLDLGAEAPEEIALTIVSEIQRVLAKGSGQSLRERKTSIHTPQSVDSSKCPTSAR